MSWLVVAVLATASAAVARAAEATAPAMPRTYYVDAARGDDARDGLFPATAWRSLSRVNTAALRPGDTVRFRRGQAWRGQLVPQSGDATAPVTYAAYGDGPKPTLQASVPMNSPDAWHHEGGNIWATAPVAFTQGPVAYDLRSAEWWLHTEAGAHATLTRAAPAKESAPTLLRIACRHSAARGNHIQLGAAGMAVESGRYYTLDFRARCTKPFAVAGISLMKRAAPWTAYGTTTPDSPAITTEWKDYRIRFRCYRTADDARIAFFLGGVLPAGATLDFQPGVLAEARCNQPVPLDVDVGNIIFDHGKVIGVKKWRHADLKTPGDYWYNAAAWQVKLCSPANPATLHSSVELAMKRHIIAQTNKHHVVYQDLALRYGAAHGIGGASTHHITVRRCDLSYIGGAHQTTRPDGHPVRYGNGIEFWSSARDNLVEHCRLWEIYDAALTNQGSGTNVQERIVYRHNVIWNCEYSFEYWNRTEASHTRHILFEHNTCVDAGHGWGHTQRPDPNGRHLMFYNNSAATTDFVVRNNIFANATDSCLRLHGRDWTAALTMDHNCWHQPKGALMLWGNTPFLPTQFADYQKKTGLDAHSIVAEPRFTNAAQRDYRLADDSPARTLSPTGGPVGALP